MKNASSRTVKKLGNKLEGLFPNLQISYYENHIWQMVRFANMKSIEIRGIEMRFLIQRVNAASCTVDGEITGKIEKGFLVFIGVSNTDTREIADKLIKKLINMRIFEDENGKTNLSLSDVGGGLLLISQFTLYADCRKGNRPSFINAGNPELAEELYKYMIDECKKEVATVETGIFGADMKIELTNDGPFTVLLDSEEMGVK